MGLGEHALWLDAARWVAKDHRKRRRGWGDGPSVYVVEVTGDQGRQTVVVVDGAPVVVLIPRSYLPE